jgi:NAD(P)-dependent dehydrogenase (short-subunit alcohol dehydrogenase family)
VQNFPGRFPDLVDRGVVITGGGSGIGAAFTEGFAREGAKVAFLDIADGPSRALAKGLAGKCRHAPHYIKADLRNVAAVKQGIAEAAEWLGAIGVLVNNAALDDRHDFLTLSEAQWDDNQAINMKQMFFAAQAAAPYLIADGHGTIVNMSSISFMLNMGDLPSYTTAKAGILGLTKSLAGRLGPDGVRVNAILPGMVVTERQKRLWLTEEGIAAMIDRQCLKRSLTAEDIVGPCLFLASDLSRGMTAQWMTIDGGVL